MGQATSGAAHSERNREKRERERERERARERERETAEAWYPLRADNKGEKKTESDLLRPFSVLPQNALQRCSMGRGGGGVGAFLVCMEITPSRKSLAYRLPCLSCSGGVANLESESEPQRIKPQPSRASALCRGLNQPAGRFRASGFRKAKSNDGAPIAAFCASRPTERTLDAIATSTAAPLDWLQQRHQPQRR